MFDGKKYTCDKEIGRPPGPYHSCGRPAVVECVNVKYRLYLHFCDRHRAESQVPGREVSGQLRPPG